MGAKRRKPTQPNPTQAKPSQAKPTVKPNCSYRTYESQKHLETNVVDRLDRSIHPSDSIRLDSIRLDSCLGNGSFPHRSTGVCMV
eukprot:jgi/Psemu1/316271/fgenesh1_kg.3067_\